MRKFARFSARGAATRAAALTCLAMFATTGAALAAPCPTQTSVTPFAQWGDTSSYFMAPGGSFEGSAATVGWTLDHAALTAGNDPFHLGSPSDSQSVTISAGGSALSPTLCLDATMPYFRFVAREVTPGSDLKAEVKLGNANAHGLVFTAGDVPDGSMPSWAPSGRLVLISAKIPKGLSFRGALRFEVPGSAGSWQLDDVYVDPYRGG